MVSQSLFRQAVSAAIDRAAIVRLVFHGRGTPLWSSTTPANKLWLDSALPQPPRSVEHAKQLLRDAGFSWNAEGALLDRSGAAVEFSILTRASNAQRSQIATQQLPIVCLASPNVLVGARQSIANLKPAILDHYTLWNAEQLYIK